MGGIKKKSKPEVDAPRSRLLKQKTVRIKPLKSSRLPPESLNKFLIAHPRGSSVIGTISEVNPKSVRVDFGQDLTFVLLPSNFEPQEFLQKNTDLPNYFQVGDIFEAVVKTVNAARATLIFSVPTQQLEKFDKPIPERHHPAKGMEIEVKEVINAAHALRDAPKQALEQGLSLAEVEVSKCREIAGAFLALTRAEGASSSSDESAAATLLGKKRAATLTTEHQQKAAKARKKTLPAKRRSEIAKDAATKRWENVKEDHPE